jgi:uncharacterized protein (DUF1697 family)
MTRPRTSCIALLRGINVGRAKRIAMPDLREVLEALGYANVRTLLNSGNAVFEVEPPKVPDLAAAISAAIERRFGFPVAVVVLTAATLTAVIAANDLLHTARDPAKLLVAFVADRAMLASARPLLAEPWAPEALSIGRDAAYMWCANGIADSPLLQALSRVTGQRVTARNWATVLKLKALARG